MSSVSPDSVHSQIRSHLGRGWGVAIIAAFADTLAVLDHVKIAKTSGPAVPEFECCGFTTTTIGGHQGKSPGLRD